MVEGVDVVLDAVLLAVVVRDREVVLDRVDGRRLALVLEALGEVVTSVCDRVVG